MRICQIWFWFLFIIIFFFSPPSSWLSKRSQRQIPIITGPATHDSDFTVIGNHSVVMVVHSGFLACQREDNSFRIPVRSCRDGFDFSLLFEETILGVLPLGLVLIIASYRLYQLFRKQRKVVTSWLLWAKLVCMISFLGQLCPVIFDLCLRLTWTHHFSAANLPIRQRGRF